MVVRNLLGQKKASDPESESLLSHTEHTEHHMSNPRVISDIILVPIHPPKSFHLILVSFFPFPWTKVPLSTSVLCDDYLAIVRNGCDVC